MPNSETVFKFATNSLNMNRIASALEMVQSDLAITPEQLDSDPNLLNVLNGTIDLRTGQLLAHTRSHYITKLVNVDYDPAAQCPVFLAFLDQVIGHLADFLQKAIGYSLTGLTSERAFFICYGAGSNGKTTLLSFFRSLLNEYATLLQVDTLMARSQETGRPPGKAVCHDIRDGRGPTSRRRQTEADHSRHGKDKSVPEVRKSV